MLEQFIHYFEATIKNTPTAVLTNIGFLPATALAMIRYNKNKETLSNLLTISVVSAVFIISAFEMELAMEYIREHHDKGSLRNILMVFASQSILSVMILYKLHTRKAYDIGPLFFHLSAIQIVFAIMHTLLWIKLNIPAWNQAFLVSHAAYSAFSLYLTATIQIACIFPKLINTRFKHIINPFAFISR